MLLTPQLPREKLYRPPKSPRDAGATPSGPLHNAAAKAAHRVFSHGQPLRKHLTTVPSNPR